MEEINDFKKNSFEITLNPNKKQSLYQIYIENIEYLSKKKKDNLAIYNENFEIKKETEYSFDIEHLSEYDNDKNSDNESEKLIDFIIEKNEKKYHNFFNSKLFISPNNSYSESSTVDSSTQYERIENSVSKSNFSLINDSFYIRKFYWFLNNNKCFKEKKRIDDSTQCENNNKNNLFIYFNEYFTIESKKKENIESEIIKRINVLKFNLFENENLRYKKENSKKILNKLIFKKEKGILFDFLYRFRRNVKAIKIIEKAKIIKSFFSKIKLFNEYKLKEKRNNILKLIILRKDEKKIILTTYFKIFRRNIKEIELNDNADIIKKFCKDKLKKIRMKCLWKDSAHSYLQNRKREIIKNILRKIFQQLISTSNNLVKEKEIKSTKIKYILNKYIKRINHLEIIRKYFFKYRRIVKQINIYINGEKIRQYLRKKLFYLLYKKKWKNISKNYIKYNKIKLIHAILKKDL